MNLSPVTGEEVIYRKQRACVSSKIQTPRSGLKNEVQPSFLRLTLRCLDIG